MPGVFPADETAMIIVRRASPRALATRRRRGTTPVGKGKYLEGSLAW